MTNCININKNVLHDIDHRDAGESYTEVEVPVRGPDPVTTLVIISGIAGTEMDICGEGTRSDLSGTHPFKLFIQTQYRFDDRSQFQDGSAYAWLTAILDDDFDQPNTVNIDHVLVTLNSNNRVELLVEGNLHGDIALQRVGYQIYVLSARPRPTPRTARTRRPTERELIDVGIRLTNFPRHG